MKAFILDDDELFLEGISIMLTNFSDFKIHKFSNYDAALKQLYNTKFDLYIIDLKLNNLFSGFDLSEYIEDDTSPLIFVSAYINDEIHDKINLLKNAAYLVKPFHEYTLESTIRTLIKNKVYLESKNQLFRISNQQSIAIDSIIYIEVDKNYCILHTSEKKHIVKISMSQILRKLPQDKFLLIHRNFAVHYLHIKSIDISKDILVTSNNIKLTISKRQGKIVKLFFTK